MSLYTTGTIRVISDPELKNINGTALVTFYGGSSEGKDKNGEYINNAIDCEVWGNQANTILEWVGKGGSFQASGQILMDEWEDKQTGQARKKHKFKISRVELLPRAKEDTPAQADACGLKPPAADACGLKPPVDETVPF